MAVFLGRTSNLKPGFLDAAFTPQADISVLKSVSVTLPQQSNTPLRQVGSRALAGNYQDGSRPATLSFSWDTTPVEARRLFTVVLTYFQERSGLVLPLAAGDVESNKFSFIGGCSIQTQGLQPTQYTLELTFLNCPDLYAEGIDPLAFSGVRVTDSEAQIKIEEDPDHDALILGTSSSLTMRGDFRWGLHGYRSLRFAEAILSQTIQTVDSSLRPEWEYQDCVEPSTATEQLSSSLGDSGPRQYSINRQVQLKPLEAGRQIKLGW